MKATTLVSTSRRCLASFYFISVAYFFQIDFFNPQFGIWGMEFLHVPQPGYYFAKNIRKCTVPKSEARGILCIRWTPDNCSSCFIRQCGQHIQPTYCILYFATWFNEWHLVHLYWDDSTDVSLKKSEQERSGPYQRIERPHDHRLQTFSHFFFIYFEQ